MKKKKNGLKRGDEMNRRRKSRKKKREKGMKKKIQKRGKWGQNK